MTTLVPRPPYSQDELDRLYPKNVKLQFVQVIWWGGSVIDIKFKSQLLRHGERSPVSARFESAGLAPFWPYCNAARRLSSITKTEIDASQWDKLEWRRRLETFGDNDAAVIATGPNGQVDGVCNLGELTDKGRDTTLALGQRLRHLYIDQLGFMPKILNNADMFYLRASPIPRALESLQQSFWGMYPLSARTASFPPPTIITRSPQDETLYPNEKSCRRFSQLSRAFGRRAAIRWNETTEMEYLSSLISKWMPDQSKVAVDSHPRLSGILDTVNSTLGHGPETRLPAPFYDSKARDILDKIVVEEWFAGYEESEEYRTVGCGPLAGDIVARMVENVTKSRQHGPSPIGNPSSKLVQGKITDEPIKFGMSGCHDTTLASLLASLGAFKGEKWPPYTSHIAFELFKASDNTTDATSPDPTPSNTFHEPSQNSFFSLFNSNPKPTLPNPRKRTEDLTQIEKLALQDHYVRIRYNDRPMVVPGCTLPGKHLEGNESFCTLEAFKAIVDKFTPKDWREACMANLEKGAFPEKGEEDGF